MYALLVMVNKPGIAQFLNFYPLCIAWLSFSCPHLVEDVHIVNPRHACAARVTVVVLYVCVFVCPIEILRMAAFSIELSHVLCIKSNYLQNGYVVCRKTL